MSLEQVARDAIAALAECVYSDDSSILYAKGVAGKAILKLEDALAQQEKPEPVAWAKMDVDGKPVELTGPPCDGNPYTLIPLCTKPPRREWVGLTADKDGKMFIEGFGYVDPKAAFAIQVKLKELNHGN